MLKRLPIAVLALALAGGCQLPGPSAEMTRIGADVPVSNRPFLDPPDDFRFVIVGDRTGGHRPGVFAHAMRQINWLRPEFVISVGDQIEGYSDDVGAMDERWDEIDAMIDRLDMRFFYVAGNHDISNPAMRRVWLSKRGRDYYHFVYKDVLFIALSTEDPPTSSEKAARLEELGVDPAQLRDVMQLASSAPQQARQMLAESPRLAQAIQAVRDADRVTISDRQLEYFRGVLRDNSAVRWTFVLMHKPAWRYDSEQFRRFEALLRDRPHTVFAGHMHSYSRVTRGPAEYIQLGTTGGTMNADPADGSAFDHVMWVTMTEAGPMIANLALDGIHDRQGPAGRPLSGTD